MRNEEVGFEIVSRRGFGRWDFLRKEGFCTGMKAAWFLRCIFRTFVDSIAINGTGRCDFGPRRCCVCVGKESL